LVFGHVREGVELKVVVTDGAGSRDTADGILRRLTGVEKQVAV
jgi:hypothetical protein